MTLHKHSRFFFQDENDDDSNTTKDILLYGASLVGVLLFIVISLNGRVGITCMKRP